jgi:D,D-heptose 1,7-bisphosphate phosphatase
MQAVIYCGGFGNRLGKITRYLPKPLIKINGKPFLYYLIENLKRFGINHIIFLSYYQNKKIIKFVKKLKYLNIKLNVITEPEASGTAGSLLLARKYLKKEFFLLNGDTYFNFNILELKKKFYENKKKIIIAALTESKNKRFLNLPVSKKHVSKDNKINYVNGGYYYVSKKIISRIDNCFSLENEVFPKLIKEKQMSCLPFVSKKNYFIDIGVPKDLKRSGSFLKKILNKKAVFLDRDGVINYDLGYVYEIKNFRWRPKIVKFIKYLNDNDFYVIIVSNQSGIGRGYYSEKDVFKLHEWVNKKLNILGAHIDEFKIAPYFKDSKKYSSDYNFFLRKPNPGMILEVFNKWNILPNKSVLIGDQFSDMMVAKNAKLRHSFNVKKISINRIIKHKFFK